MTPADARAQLFGLIRMVGVSGPTGRRYTSFFANTQS